MPFAEMAGDITGRLQVARDRVRSIPQAGAALAQRLDYAGTLLILPGEQRRACGRTNGRIGMKVGQSQTFLGQAIKVRRRRPATAVATQITVAQVIGKYEYYIWSTLLLAKTMPIFE